MDSNTTIYVYKMLHGPVEAFWGIPRRGRRTAPKRTSLTTPTLSHDCLCRNDDG
jgi:hypothetical protein